MARPQRHNVDYFPHYISDGRKMFIIETKYGNDGYSAWFKILETLAKSDDHWIDLSDKANLMFLSARCRISENLLCDIIGTLAELGEVDAELWTNESVVWSDKFIESIADAYDKRSNNPPSKQGLVERLRGLGRCKPLKFPIKGAVKPQTIVEDTIPNQTKEPKGVTAPHPLVKWIESNAPTIQRLREPLTNEQAERLLADLNIDTEPKKKQLRELLMNMENYKPLTTKSKSANLTIRKWWAKQGEYNGTAQATEKLTITKGVYYK